MIELSAGLTTYFHIPTFSFVVPGIHHLSNKKFEWIADNLKYDQF